MIRRIGIPGFAAVGLLLVFGTLAAVPPPASAPVASTAVTITPIHRVKPVYPRAAVHNGIQGCVRLRFDINKAGRPTNFRVWMHYPSGAFDQAAVRTVSKWRFRVTGANGKPASVRDVFQEINFLLYGDRSEAVVSWLCRQPPPRTLIVAAAPATAVSHGITVTPHGDRIDLVQMPVPPGKKLVDGWVKTKFCIGPNGNVTRARAVDASPRGLYDQAALTALLGWKFSGRIANGKQVKTCGLAYEIPVIARASLARGPMAVAQGPLAIDMGSGTKRLPEHGYVEVRFCVDTDGSVNNVEIVKSHPKGAFDQAALRLARERHYWPEAKNGKAMQACGVEQTITFRHPRHHAIRQNDRRAPGPHFRAGPNEELLAPSREERLGDLAPGYYRIVWSTQNP